VKQRFPWTPKTIALATAAMVAVSGALAMYGLDAWPGVEQTTVNVRFALQGASRPRDVAVVAIDEKTFAALRLQWPLPRSLHAEVIDRLRAVHVRAIVYDVQFTEPTSPREDLALYRAIGRAGNVVLATTSVDAAGHTDVLGGDANVARAHAVAAAANMPSDANGVIGRYPYSLLGLPSLAVAGIEAAGQRISPARFDRGTAWIDYRGPPGTITTVSFSDLLAGTVAARILAGKIVVVGATSPTLQDVHPTPTTAANEPMAGAEIEANAIWTALHGNPLQSTPTWLALLAILLAGAAAPLAALKLRMLPATFAAILVAGAYVLAAQVAFESGTVLLVTYPLAAWSLGTIGMVGASYVAARAEQRALATQLHDSHIELVARLAAASESRDEDTGRHILRIGVLCERLALAIGWSPSDAETLRHASAMHDVGKIGIRDRILLKPGRLTPDEWEIMKRHTTIGAEILAGSASPLVQMAETIARSHHERWDGGGYPDGLKGEEIPLVGRICAVCDVFDALLSARPYKGSWSVSGALSELEHSAGTHLDHRLVDTFLTIAHDDEAEIQAAYPLHGSRPVAVNT
jgi:CHASE2 domain-containing sensor protein